MTLLEINLTDVLSETDPDDRVVVWAPVFREGPAGGLVGPRRKSIPLVDGVGSDEVVPGPLMVQVQCKAMSDTRPREVVVPEEGPVTLTDLLHETFTYTPAVVGQVAQLRDEAAQAVADAEAAVSEAVEGLDLMERSAAEAADQALSQTITDFASEFRTRTGPPWLPAMMDLDDQRTVGRYRTVTSSTSGNPDLHYPPGAMHGWLDVIDMQSGAGTYLWQLWVDTWSNFVAVRRWYAGAWTPWVRLGEAEAAAAASSAVTPVAARVTALENAAPPVQVASGSTAVYSPTRPDYWATPAGDGIFWQGTDHHEYIAPDYRGEGYVGIVGDAAGYTTMQIEKTTYGDIYVSCINPDTNRHVTYLVETGNVAGARQDDFAIVADTWVGAYTGGAAQRDTLVARRSNREWAVQIDVGGTSKWVPYHGTPTAYAAGPRRITDSHGAPIDLASMSTGQAITVTGIKIHQPLYARHPDTGSTNYAMVDQVTTIAPDGLVQSETTMTALRDFTMDRNYGPMTMMEMGVVNQFHVLGGGSYPLTATPPTSTVYQDVPEGKSFTSGLATGEDIFVAVGLLSPERMWMSGRPLENTYPAPLRIEDRSSGMLKVYPSPVETGALIPAGTTWEFGAQWRYGETTNPAQYA